MTRARSSVRIMCISTSGSRDTFFRRPAYVPSESKARRYVCLCCKRVAFSSKGNNSAVISARESVRGFKSLLGTSTKSKPGLTACRESRRHSLIKRRSLFRQTAEPVFLVTAVPKRHGCALSARSRTKRTKLREKKRRPQS